MPSPPHRQGSDVVIVTTEAKIAAIVDVAVDRAVRRAVTDALAERDEVVDWLPARDAEKAYGRSRSTLHRWRRAGLIEAKSIAGSVYYRRPGAEGTSNIP